MRTSLIGLVLAASCFMGVVGCDDDTSPADAAAADLSVTTPPPDLKTTPSQDGPAAPKNCLAVVTCAQSCGTNTSCVAACAAGATTSAQMKYTALLGCGFAHCVPGDGGLVLDGGAGSCTSFMDTTPHCAMCIGVQVQGAGCSTELNACLTD